MTFEHLKTIYRGYDIRGKYPEQINEEEVYKIGRAIVVYLDAKTIVVGRDIRTSSTSLFDALSKGITDQGANVINIGLATTPIVYHASGTLDVEGGVCITASHMTKEFNGIKIMRGLAVPIGIASGLLDIKALVEKNDFKDVKKKGSVTESKHGDKFYDHIRSLTNLKSKKFKIVVDPANMMGVLDIEFLKTFKNLEIIPIFDEFDENTPNHEANPLKIDTLETLMQEVKKQNADIGLAFDGDADRCGFIDEKGEFVRSDLVSTLILETLLKNNPGETILYDLRSSNIAREIAVREGGKAFETKVGHSNVKADMLKHDAIYGFELSGHQFFRDNFYAEAGPLPLFYILELMEAQNKTFSELIKEVDIYFHSTEINSTITKTPEEVNSILENKYKGGKVSKLDGLKIEFKDWWFNTRPSANDPVMRLNLEANTKKLMEEKRDEILDIIRSS